MNIELPVIAPSILAADFTQLGSEIDQCIRGGARWIHCDIMDGHFVPNISYGADIVAAADSSAPEAFLDVHLMIEKPDLYIESFSDAGADLISVHSEACPHLHRTLQNIQSHGCMTGVALNPATPVSIAEPVINDVDLVLIMSVNPGFGGQSFIENSYEKVRRLVQLRSERQADFLIEVDGGVNLKNTRNLVQAGADILVAGSTIFKSGNIVKRLQELRELANSGRKDFV